MGGARFHGLGLANFLKTRGDDIYVLNRGVYRSEYPRGITHLIADRNDREKLKETIGERYFDVVVDNNAYNQEQVKSALDLIHARCKHYIFTSSAAVYLALFSTSKLKEDEAKGVERGPFSPKVKEYALNKFAAENAVRRNAHNLNFTILRFPNIFGEGDFAGKLASLYYRLKDRSGVLLEKEVREFSLVYVKDVVNIFAALLGNKRCYNKTLNVCDPRAYNYDEFFKTVYGDLYILDKLILRDAERLWEDGFHPHFVWGPMIDTTSLEEILEDTNFTTPLSKWCNPTLKWETEHFKDLYEGQDYARIRKDETELIKKYAK